ncbi:MAG: hydroxymethylglutaryl-CoA reductase, degradative [Leptolinea sp.]|jgi:hydroxymethylglutaryl-CoA reductase|nr:hydroxymethylglutaryl-CoA reductase, degradative [Leptolinea sp.]
MSTKSMESLDKLRFYELTLQERGNYLRQETSLTEDDIDALSGLSGLTAAAADKMVENAIGVFALPIGIAQNFVINGRKVWVPMVVEEPSVIAGASFMARLARSGGGFFASSDEPLMIGQMQILETKDPFKARDVLIQHGSELLAEAAGFDPVLTEMGGGPRELDVRLIDQSPIGPFPVLHIIMDVRDAMGANAVNTACERLAPRVEALTGGRVHLRILSNLADRRLARAHIAIPVKELAFDDYSGEQVRDGIIEAWAFAAADPYRAATHNKGIMNGVDAVVMATGNDWRAVEAGAHAYAARHGVYTSLSTWGRSADGALTGSLEMPMAVGIIGGSTRVHPGAKAAVKLLGVKTARELAEIIVSVGLAQNLAALRALATEGIQRGHMTLHARQVAVAAGAEGAWIDRVADRMVAEKTIRIDRAEEILKELKAK